MAAILVQHKDVINELVNNKFPGLELEASHTTCYNQIFITPVAVSNKLLKHYDRYTWCQQWDTNLQNHEHTWIPPWAIYSAPYPQMQFSYNKYMLAIVHSSMDIGDFLMKTGVLIYLASKNPLLPQAIQMYKAVLTEPVAIVFTQNYAYKICFVQAKFCCARECFCFFWKVLPWSFLLPKSFQPDR